MTKRTLGQAPCCFGGDDAVLGNPPAKNILPKFGSDGIGFVSQ